MQLYDLLGPYGPEVKTRNHSSFYCRVFFGQPPALRLPSRYRLGISEPRVRPDDGKVREGRRFSILRPFNHAHLLRRRRPCGELIAWLLSKGASINDIRKIFGFLDAFGSATHSQVELPQPNPNEVNSSSARHEK